jgi:two-component system response regulator YesN
MLFGYILYTSSFNVFRQEVEDYNKSKLYQMMSVIDNQIKNLEKVSLNIAFNNNLYPFVTEDNDYWINNNFVELKTYLVNNIVNNEIVDEIILFLDNKDFVFTSRGKTSNNTLFRNIISVKEEDIQRLTELLKSIEEPVVIKIPKKEPEPSLIDTEKHNISGDENGYYTFFAYPAYMYPIPMVKSDTYGTVLFKIDFTKLNEIMKTTLGSMAGDIYIYTDKLVELSSIEKGNLANSDEVKSIVKSRSLEQAAYSDIKFGQQACCTTYLKDNKLFVISINSSTTKYHYAVVLNVSDYFNKVTNLGRNVLVILVCVILAGFIMSILLAINNYKPVQSLIKLMNETEYKSYKRTRFKNEFDKIETSIYSILQENKLLINKVRLQKPYVEEQVILMLIKGNISNKDTMLELLSLSSIDMDKPCFATVVLNLKDKLEAVRSDIFTEIVFYNESFMKNNFNGNCYSMEIVKGDIAILLNADYDSLSIQNLGPIFEKLQHMLNRDLQIKVNIGIGRVYSDIADISTSFNEAVSALEYNVIRGQDKVLFFEDIVAASDKIYWYPIEEQTRFVQFLKQGDSKMFNLEIEKILKSIKDKNLSTGMVKAILFGIVNCIINVVNDLNTDIFTEEIEELTTFCDPESLKSNLGNVAIKICNYIDMRKKSGNEELKLAMLDYIHRNYTDNSLSLDMISSELNVTAKYLSRIFKETVGCRFGDYVRQLRIKRAKILLTDSDMSVSEIVNTIGYNDAANFIRTFRLLEGITPGNFRKINS